MSRRRATTDWPIYTAAYEQGLALGRSDAALENRPTPEQHAASRVALVLQFGSSCSLFGHDHQDSRNSFIDGYLDGKEDPEGARRRVAIKRAMGHAETGGT